MTYAWGEDGSLAMTNHKGHVAVFFSLTGSENEPYEILYSGKVQRGLDNALFDTEMVSKKNSRAKFKYGIDRGWLLQQKTARRL